MKIDGKELRITPGSFEEVCDLQEAIANGLKGTGIKLNLKGFSLDGDVEGDIGGIIESLLSLVTSKELRNQLFTLSERCIFGEGKDAQKVDRDFFETIENRKYYYQIMVEVGRVNLSSFFGVASSALSESPMIKGIFQKLSSMLDSKSKQA